MIGARKGSAQAGRVGEIGGPNLYPARRESRRLARVTHARHDPGSWAATQQAIHHRAAKLPICPCYDDHHVEPRYQWNV
ncbi:hypothetical protein AcidC75_18460 [Acidisoma sp. C75]